MTSDISDEVRAHYSKIGTIGGNKLKEMYGSDYYKKISAMRKRYGRLSKEEKEKREASE